MSNDGNDANDVDGEGYVGDMNEETSKTESKLETVDAGREVASSEMELENDRCRTRIRK